MNLSKRILSKFESIMNETLMSDKLALAFSTQMIKEFESAYLYFKMAEYADFQDFEGISRYFLERAEEEMIHANKIAKFLSDRGNRIIFQDIKAPSFSADGILSLFKETLDHEILVTKLINELKDLARSENDHAADHFLNWFVEEQIEEEKSSAIVLKKAELAEGDPAAMIEFDKELGEEN